MLRCARLPCYFIKHKDVPLPRRRSYKLDYDLRFPVTPSATKYLRLETARRRPLKTRRGMGRRDPDYCSSAKTPAGMRDFWML